MSDKAKEFKEYQVVHNFMYPNEPLKGWINKDNFIDPFESWDMLMQVVAKIEQLPNAYDTEEFLLIRDELATARLESVYRAVVDYIEWYESKYPFKEGDTYWTIEKGEVVTSCWDDVSEDLHDENPERVYYSTEESAKAVCKPIEKAKSFTILELNADSESPMIGTIDNIPNTKQGEDSFKHRLIEALSEHFDSDDVHSDKFPDLFTGSPYEDMEINIDDTVYKIRIFETWIY